MVSMICLGYWEVASVVVAGDAPGSEVLVEEEVAVESGGRFSSGSLGKK
jgi:hypothetical protein